ncbi:MAG: TlpA family protein disulfide reductase [Gemmatimonadota bacterium]|nr:MAG: TlpA family protein disulfide reductase [Gemmatimonadota bacterium]
MSLKKLLIPATAIPIVALLAYGLTRDPNMIESPLPGHEAFDFTSATLDGDTLSLADLRGKVVVINFWASWCIACIDEHQVFVEAERYYAGQDFQMLGVVYQDTPENARRWMARRGGNWPSVIDPSSRIAIDYGVYGVPETYFIDKGGWIQHKQIGPVNTLLMRDLVDRLLAESPGTEVTSTGALEGGVPTGRSAGHTGDAAGQAAGSDTQEGQP